MRSLWCADLRFFVSELFRRCGYREASIRIADSETLQNFCRLRKKRSIDFTLLNICPEATGARNDGTWQYVLGLDGDERTARLAFDPGTAWRTSC